MLFFGIVCLIACTFCRAADDDKCQSFAGGSVFPQETRRTSGHAIQWSQAVSKFCIQRASFPVLGLSWNLTTVYESQPLCQLLIFMALFLFARSISFGINTFRRNSCFFYVFVFQKLTCIHWHNNTAAHVRMCFMGQCQCLSDVYLFLNTYCSVDMYSTLQFYQTCSFGTERSIRDFLLYFL